MTKMSTILPSSHAAPTLMTAGLRASQYSIMRMSNECPEQDKIVDIPIADAFSVIVQLKEFASHKLWRGGRLSYVGGHAQSSVAVTYLGDEFRCQHLAAFDNLRFNLPRSTLEAFAYEEGKPRLDGFDCASGTLDPVVYHLACALLPTLNQLEEVNRLFVDQVMLALCTHLSTQYGHSQPAKDSLTRGLSAWQERRAKEVMANHLADGVTIAQMASECSLSRSHFARAFKKSTGMAPHVWLMQMRIEKAQELLRCPQLSLSQIGLDCGFADQSHFTRVFSRMVGISPCNWRRFHRA